MSLSANKPCSRKIFKHRPSVLIRKELLLISLLWKHHYPFFKSAKKSFLKQQTTYLPQFCLDEGQKSLIRLGRKLLSQSNILVHCKQISQYRILKFDKRHLSNRYIFTHASSVFHTPQSSRTIPKFTHFGCATWNCNIFLLCVSIK